MSYGFRIAFTGNKEIKGMLTRIANHGKDMKPYMSDVANRTMNLFATVFSNEGMPSWKPRIDPSESHPILNKTGALKRSWTERGAAGNVLEIHPKSFTLGSEIMVGGHNLGDLHQFGTRNMVARPLLTTMTRNAIKMIAVQRLMTYYKKIFPGRGKK